MYSCPCAYHEFVWRSGGIVPVIPNLDREWRVVSLVSFTHHSISPLAKDPQYSKHQHPPTRLDVVVSQETSLGLKPFKT
jgi:hypothetical protein